MAEQGKLQRSRNAWVAGVCAGIAEYKGVDTLVVRILFVLTPVACLGLGAIA